MRQEEHLQPAEHKRIADFIALKSGIQLPEHKRSLIETRLRRRVKATGYKSFIDYLNFTLSSDGAREEQILLIDALTTNTTDFFREPGHFDFLCHYLSNHWVDQSGSGFTSPLKVWSAACSTGEEPYTLAMVLSELRGELVGFEFTIDATDIAPSVLETAKKGIYAQSRIAPVAEYLRKKYLLKSRDPAKALIRMDTSLRACVHFYPFNLITGHYPTKPTYDVIFCRNVLIYFNGEDREKILRRLRMALRPGGLLFIGHSENIGTLRDEFETLIPTVFRRIG
ncbi:CheR family methyltransferase [Salinivibrio sharmensis]|uniref:Chemotaxis protein methyltransferase n=1 Tax=Salinivibrio sharmensis TaxID=390883 RepID=A0ABX3KI12_9GAMM|nr:CheR family methyltransferase [Salinivibrio sharmensis]OOE89003.1 hypothetical protein BZG74_07090 [Salinivibrio sharmensis]